MLLNQKTKTTKRQTTIKKQKKETMETTIISIITGSTTGVLKEIRENNIHHTYLGIDQNNHLLMQLSYDDENKKIIEGIYWYMREMEIITNEICAITGPLIELAKKEEEKRFEEYKQKQQESQKKRDEIKKMKQHKTNTETTNT